VIAISAPSKQVGTTNGLLINEWPRAPFINLHSLSQFLAICCPSANYKRTPADIVSAAGIFICLFIGGGGSQY